MQATLKVGRIDDDKAGYPGASHMNYTPVFARGASRQSHVSKMRCREGARNWSTEVRSSARTS